VIRRRGARPTKEPFAADGSGWAKADDPATWAVRARAEGWAARNVNGAGGGIGLQLGAVPERPGTSLGGVDLDTCRDPVTGALEPWAAEVAEKLGSYTEVSPSGTGV
jgi:putative DNA primase/helicase